MYKAKIKNISKERHQVKNNDFLKVSFDILDSDNNVLQSKSIGMFIDSKEEEVTEEVNKHIAEYKREVKNIENNKKEVAIEKNFEEVKNNLVGKTIDTSLDSKE